MLPTTVCDNFDGIEGQELTDNVDARGHYTIGKELVEDVIDRIRRVAGKIDNYAMAKASF